MKDLFVLFVHPGWGQLTKFKPGLLA